MSDQNYSLGQVGDYEIRQLKIFKTVVNCGGFSAAETALNIGRSTISLHITNLESRLNLILCKRGRGGFSLTEEGKIIHQMTENLLESLDAFRTTVNNLNRSLTGKLRIALSDTVSLDTRSHFPELIQHFSMEAPKVFITTSVSSMAVIERMILNDEADIGFIPYHRKLDGLEYFHLYSDTCYLYCSKNHPLATMNVQEQIEQADTYPASHAGLKPHESISDQISTMNYAKSYIEKGDIVTVAPSDRFYNLGVALAYKKTAQPNKARELFLNVLQKIFYT